MSVKKSVFIRVFALANPFYQRHNNKADKTDLLRKNADKNGFLNLMRKKTA
jgi:hypothetical protein